MPPTELSPRQDALLREFRAGRKSALARVISIIEDERPGFRSVLEALHPALGRTHRIGVTGPPGAGKSTLSAALVMRLRERGETVGVAAVDPTSPFTGGALLGDRIRMNDAAQDPGVFIRSMATRGALGGLAVTSKEVADAMDAFGFDRVLLETAGVGQSELDVVAAADSTVVVLVPESGDSIQAMKAGLMEIADIFVVNKADRPGAERLAREVRQMLHLRAGQALRNVPVHHGVDLRRARAERRQEGGGAPPEEAAPAREAEPPEPAPAAAEPWEIPVLRTEAESGAGVEELLDTLERHRTWLRGSGELERRREKRLRERVREEVQRRLLAATWRSGPGDAMLEEAAPALLSGSETPYALSARIVRAVLGESAPQSE